VFLRNMHKEHLKLNQADYHLLMRITAQGQAPARVFKRATALLQLHQGQTLCAVAQALQISYKTVARWRNSYRSRGLLALQEQPRRGRPIRIDGHQRAQLTALACSTPPAGRARWTLRLLADKAVELGYCSQLSHTQARSILKKTVSSLTCESNGVWDR
jgi:putative transposase